jgi:hypothetical protein
VEDLGRADIGFVHVFWGVEHIRAGVAVEHEFSLAVGAQGDESQPGASRGREAQGGGVYPGLMQHARQEMTEGIVAHHAHEAGRYAQAAQANRDIPGRPARGFLESRRVN